MRLRSPKDLLSGLIFCVIAIGFAVLSSRYQIGDMHRMGPALFPTIVATLLGGLGLLIAGRSFVLDGPPLPNFPLRPILMSIASMALFGVALQWHGLIVAIAILVIVGSYASKEVRFPSVVILAAALILFSLAIFVWILGLPIPLWPDS